MKERATELEYLRYVYNNMPDIGMSKDDLFGRDFIKRYKKDLPIGYELYNEDDDIDE
jgi:hypothetical protein